MLEVLQISFTGVALAIMLTDFMQPGMIFDFYGAWLDKIGEFIAKPLGGCITCFSMWCIIFMGIMYIWFYPVWVGLSCLAVGNLLLGILDRFELL